MDASKAKYDEILKTVPDVIHALALDFRDNKDFNDRAKIKMRIKILLDLMGVDTAHPQKIEPKAAPEGYMNIPIPNNWAAPAHARLDQPDLGAPLQLLNGGAHEHNI